MYIHKMLRAVDKLYALQTSFHSPDNTRGSNHTSNECAKLAARIRYHCRFHCPYHSHTYISPTRLSDAIRAKTRYRSRLRPHNGRKLQIQHTYGNRTLIDRRLHQVASHRTRTRFARVARIRVIDRLLGVTSPRITPHLRPEQLDARLVYAQAGCLYRDLSRAAYRTTHTDRLRSGSQAFSSTRSIVRCDVVPMIFV